MFRQVSVKNKKGKKNGNQEQNSSLTSHSKILTKTGRGILRIVFAKKREQAQYVSIDLIMAGVVCKKGLHPDK